MRRQVKPTAHLSTHRIPVIALLLGASACDPKDVAEVDHDTADGPAPVACDTPLAVTPTDTDVTAHGLVQLVATGGSGAYVFTLAEDGSGASVNASTGAYQSGGVADVTDVVVVTDEACEGEVSTSIRVHSQLTASPDAIRVAPGTTVTVAVTGGSGTYTCALASDASGGALADCAHTVGATSGTDIVRVTDTITGAFDDVVVIADPAATFRVAGGGHLFLPEGSRFRPDVVGGSGALTLEVVAGAFSVDGDVVVASTPGTGTLRVSDRYAALSADVPVTVLPALSADLPRDGERSGHGVVARAGDIDGDGYDDAVLGFIDVGIDANFGGAVVVYAGGPDGLLPAPVRTLSGTNTEDTLGRDVEVADTDGDGLVDLLVGVDKSDQGGVNLGQVRIYAGRAGAYFSEAPTRTLGGENAYGRFGSALAVCDFDGDGWRDLAVGAVEDEDLATATPADAQGAIHVYKGGADGYGDDADFVLYGELPDGAGGFTAQSGMMLGSVLAAGDLDGDGLCDLAAGAPEGSFDGAGGDADGLVVIYRGTAEDGLTLTRDPAAILVPSSTVDEFGRRLAIGDVDGDGRADLAVGEWKSDRAATDGGAAWLFYGLDLDDLDPAAPVDSSDADWWVFGAEGSGYLGSDLDLADLDGDGLDELIVGEYRDGIGDPGGIRVYAGAELASAPAGTDATNEAPWRTVGGVTTGGRLGQAVAGVGDADGDGAGDLLALAGYDSTWGVEAGAAWFVPGDGGGGTATPTLLDWPGVPNGHAIGQGLALYDVDGDGARDLVVGAPDAPDAAVGANAGVVLAWTGGAPAAWEGDGAALLGGHATHGGGDRFGYAVTAAGDFDGDGYEDLAVTARKDARPSAWDASQVGGACTAGALTDAGAVFVYLGGPGGLSEEPAFVFYGPGDHVYGVDGGFDHDGDGFADLLVRSWSWTDAGGFVIVYGRPAVAGGTAVVCDAEAYVGSAAFDRVGYGGAVLGDLDGDGCDEVAVGSTGEELDGDYFNQGSVRVLWGWGGPGCAETPEVSTLAQDVVGTGLGSSLAGGGDVDGDGLPDLLVGGAEYREELAEVGVAWLVPGWHLLDAPREARAAGTLPEDDATAVFELLPSGGLDATYGIKGEIAGDLFGSAVALVPDPLAPGRAAVAIGAPQGAAGGTDLAGAVTIHRWGASGLDPVPWAIVGGESRAPGGGLGATLFGADVDGEPVLVVGAPESHQAGTEVGAVYVVRLTD